MKIFSIPINPKLNQREFSKFYSFLTDYKNWIYDLYFTCRMPPFIQDAMGEVILEGEIDAIDTALKIQENTGIPVSATFNNIMVRPDQSNLDLFIKNFKQLYDSGIRSATIPHTHWISTGQLQKEFPDLFIKNTILRNVNTAADVAKLAQAGFHYVNLERDLMRDRDTLKKMRRVKEKFGIKLSLLANEGCLGGCPMMDEHFQFNNTRISVIPQYFNDPISRVSCPKWEREDPSTMLKTANFPPWREDWMELLEYVDVIKMHGRESVSRLFETMDIVKRFSTGTEILFDSFKDYLEETNLSERPINAWRTKIKNCKFDCWECDYCDRVYAAKSDIKSHPLVLAVTKELVDSVNYNLDLDVLGLTSKRVQNLLFGISQHCSHYLELGCAIGATTSAVAKNPYINITAIDNWAQDIGPENEEFDIGSNSKEIFRSNLSRKDITIIDKDMFSLDTSQVTDVDFMFYDGPHDFESVKSAVIKYKSCLGNTAILIFDDANWEGVVSGANAGVEETGSNVLYSKIILNSTENPTQWWNGLYILVIQQ